jgi:excisionase family DNA binding protein
MTYPPLTAGTQPYTLPEASRALGVSVPTLRSWYRADPPKIGAYRQGRDRLIPATEVQRILDERHRAAELAAKGLDAAHA